MVDNAIGIRKKMTIKERTNLHKLINGKISQDSIAGQELLNRPHIAIAFEAILDKYNLSDNRLVARLAEIIKRKATISENKATGTKATNIAAIDANAKDTIKLIWQIQGKFVEKHEFKGELGNMKDEELDKIIDTGTAFLLNKGKNRLDGSTIGTG